MTQNTLPFQYGLRAHYIESLSQEDKSILLEQRDRELEDYLGTLGSGGGGTGPPGPQGPPGVGVPAGGTTGQVLAKTSATDYDTEWIDQPETATQMPYIWSDSTTVADPGPGHMRVNAADPATATLMAISGQDANGVVRFALHQVTNGDQLVVYEANDTTRWMKFSVVGDPINHAAAWGEIPLAFFSVGPGGFDPSNNENVEIVIRTGGEGGGGGGTTILDGTVPPTPADGAEGDYYEDTTAGILYGPKNATGWGAQQIPSIAGSPTSNITTSDEAGTRWTVRRNGRIVGARYWRGTASDLTTTVHLWASPAGTLLATKADTQAAVLGKFTVLFDTPVAVTAGDVIVVTAGNLTQFGSTFTQQVVTNTADLTFVDYRQNPTINTFPNAGTTSTHYVEPIYEPTESWSASVRNVYAAQTVLDPELAAIAALTSAADQLPYFTGSGTAALTPLTSTARTLLDDTNTTAMQSTLGVPPTTRAINTTAPLTGGGNLTADRTLAITAFAGSAAGAVPASPGGTANFLRADGTWAAPPAAGTPNWPDGYPTYDARYLQPAAADTAYVNVGGDTMTGSLVMSPGANISAANSLVSVANPTADSHAVPRRYVTGYVQAGTVTVVVGAGTNPIVGSLAITFSPAYTAAPIVVVSLVSAAPQNATVGVSAITASGATINVARLIGAGANWGVNWSAVGTPSL
jgi:hypothetical protein